MHRNSYTLAASRRKINLSAPQNKNYANFANEGMVSGHLIRFHVGVGVSYPTATLAKTPAVAAETSSGSSAPPGAKAGGYTTIRQRTRLKVAIRGAVQGVGFRPFIYRLATELHLTGWVNNSAQGVFVEVEGPPAELEIFLRRLDTEHPPRGFIQSLEPSRLDPVGYAGFEIRPSETGGEKTALVLPDAATCPDCLREIFDPRNRRHLYPFTNCTHCGPRFSIIEALPYDRANTSMKNFTMCPACQFEYDDPANRRFHAQPNACPVCGPQLAFWQSNTDRLKGRAARSLPPNHPALRNGHAALLAAAKAIRRRQIVAIKGLGGFHLIVAAHEEQAICRLRARKHREGKPLAVMFPTLAAVKAVCKVSPLEERLLQSPEAPIVLLKKIPNAQSPIAPSIAPGNPYLGVMLPYTPLHHLLLAELGFPVVCTSGNLSDEPICTDEDEAYDRLREIADVFLVHNRPIVRHVDDSIVRVMLDREMILRRARGYAPLPVQMRNAECEVRNELPTALGINSALRTPHSEIVLAVGAHLKNSVALAVGNQIFVSQHIGDLETEQANHAFRRVAAELPALYEVKPAIIAADLHPDYLSTKFALERVAQASLPAGSGGIPAASSNAEQGCSANPQAESPRYIGVQHHIAHVLSCMAENELAPPVLGVAWDGTGYGLDGTIWGGEFFLVTETKIERVAHLRPFRLPGGDKAVKEPRRVALGLLYELMGEEVFEHKDLPTIAAFSPTELAALRTMLARGINSPVTTSMGRLFDAVASLTGLRQHLDFEGQAAMDLEFALEDVDTEEHYRLLSEHGSDGKNQSPIILDWAVLLEGILADVRHGVSVEMISAKFHNALFRSIVGVANRLNQPRVVLSGGCFQNRYLTETTVRRLQLKGFRPYWHQRVPPNDGGIALGQVMAALREQKTI
ncbi:MAG: carbamoyltransferase HypF [Verrucomicrobia bacterium]|nr:carbamoyltransferase HypF [Verrucomicrobiota bacterium]